VELPTYTNIWKIEKRLYKLYDFRLPMPLPVGQVAAFLAIAVPYAVILAMAGMPFSHTWLWLYVLPPGVLAWLVTRPVLEGKRLPELALSQLRYLAEPRSWCRMAPLTEKDQIAVSATVWRRPAAAAVPAPAGATGSAAAQDVTMTAGRPARALARAVGPDSLAAARQPAPARYLAPARGATPGREAAAREHGRVREPAVAGEQSPAREPGLTSGIAAQHTAQVPQQPDDSHAGGLAAVPAAAAATLRPAWPERPAIGSRALLGPAAATGTAVPADPAQASSPGSEKPATAGEPGQGRQAVRPALTVRADAAAAGHLNVVERALRTPRADGWRESVVVVPGGHRPGKPDQVQRDQARARLSVSGPARIVVLGCTGGAGQTIVTLLTGQVLTSLRGEPVAVLDLAAGSGSLTECAREIPRLLPGRRGIAASARAGEDKPGSQARERGLQVVTADDPASPAEDAGRLIDAVVARYQLTLADPDPRHVPRALQVADQLVLVAPASADAAGALAMTLEWLEAHGHQPLARSAVTVLNGISDQTGGYVEKAAAVAAGRCRAVVRVPWDTGLAAAGPLAMPTVQAFTALAGVLVAGLADVPQAGRAGR
jgi:TcpE family